MVIREKSLEEKEKADEEALNSNIHDLNFFFKEGDTNEFLNSLANLSKDSNLGCFVTTSNWSTRSKERNSLSSMKEELTFENSGPSQGFVNESTVHSILAQNIEIYEEVLKIMVLGDKSTGKSLLISKLLSKGDSWSYIPTKSLEIHNIIQRIAGKLVKLEIFDTCSRILNDDLIKSKQLHENSIL
jgi:hypothetical protein